MSDPAPSDAKQADAKAQEAQKPKAQRSPLIPMLAGALLVVAIGAGASWFIVKSLTPAPPESKDKREGGEEDRQKESEGAAHGKGLLELGKELEPIMIKSNITGSGGTRYVTMQVGIWVPTKDHAALNDAAVRRLIQTRLEETVKTYQLEDLASPNILPRLRKDFASAVERLLRSVRPGRPPDQPFVLECAVTELLVQ
ncbi:MAG: hypothetical protein NZ552_04660 [Planctomycetes bacterium]|nr:hypothetical protein [Planctomycetota bacterium]